MCVGVGPGAGVHGGRIVAQGTPQEILANPASLTGKYLTGELSVGVPARRKPNPKRMLRISGARGNNLKNVSAEIPLGVFTCVTGVSGGGKSTLLIDTLYKAVARRLNAPARPLPPSTSSRGWSISTRSSTSTSPHRPHAALQPGHLYGGVHAHTRMVLWAAGGEGPRLRAGRFSFNVKGGRCEACQGDGVIKIEMHFLPDVYVTCDVCKGKRYNRETLEVVFKDKSIADVLDMTVDEGCRLLQGRAGGAGQAGDARARRPWLYQVGQQANTLSGGEAQRVKLAKELSKRATGRTLYILDEPTTGLHFHDVASCWKCCTNSWSRATPWR